MNAADGALASARPVKNSRKAMPPPTTPMTPTPSQSRRSMCWTSARLTTVSASTNKTAAAIPFLSVVKIAGSAICFTANEFTKIDTPLMAAVTSARTMPT